MTVWTPVRAEEAVADSVATEQAADGVVTEDAVADTDTTEQGLDVQGVIFGHMSDAYEWHITNIGRQVDIHSAARDRQKQDVRLACVLLCQSGARRAV